MLPISFRTLKASRTEFHALSNRGIPVPWEPQALGEHLRKRRIQLGLHQPEAARRLGVSTVALSRWECGKMRPRFFHYEAIIAYLGYDPFRKMANTVHQNGEGNETIDVAMLLAQGSNAFGGKFREIRLDRRLTAKKCAAILEADVKSIRNWETGKKRPMRSHQKTIQKWFAES